jgi:hypothetical protein
VGLIGAFTMRCRSSMVLCTPLMLNVTAFIAGCLYVSVFSLLCVFACGAVCIVDV